MRRFLTQSPVTFVVWIAVVCLVVLCGPFRGQAEIGPGKVSVSFSPARAGETRLSLPPVGALAAHTHRAPVSLDVELRSLDVGRAIDVAGSSASPTARQARGALEASIRDDLDDAVRRVVLQLLLLSVVAGSMGALTFPGRRSLRRCVAGALLGPLTAAAMVGPVALGYDADALARRPVLSGQLGSAEELLGRVARLETPYGSVESRSRVLAERLAGLYSASLTDEISRSDGEVVLLHVSDLHLSAVGAAMTAELARSFQVDAVIDSGDITSFGFEPEAEFVAPLDDLEVPYLLVAGNHDSAGVRERLAASAVVRLLDGDSVDIRGVRVLGIGDPTMTALERVPRAQLDRQYRDQFAVTSALIGESEPDVLLVHNPVQARPALGRVPVVAAGHLHRSELELLEGTTLTVVGSSGATGLGNLLTDEQEPYQFELLRFLDGELVAIDRIELPDAGGDLRLERDLIRPDARRLDTSEVVRARVDEPSLADLDPDDPDDLRAEIPTTAEGN